MLYDNNGTKHAVMWTQAPVLPVDNPAKIAAIIPISFPI